MVAGSGARVKRAAKLLSGLQLGKRGASVGLDRFATIGRQLRDRFVQSRNALSRGAFGCVLRVQPQHHLRGFIAPRDPRWRASHVAMGALHHAGFFGFGPGTFRAVFPAYNTGSVNQVPGTWRFLHEDYLQTLLEWGWLGSSFWALLFFGGITVGIRSYRKHAKRDWTPRRRVLQPLVIMALIGVAFHALVDFPLQIESIQLYAATYLGLCWGSALWREGSSATEVRHSFARNQRSETRLK